MSSFNCEQCNQACIDTDIGYVTGCEHSPADPGAANKYLFRELCKIDAALPVLISVAKNNGHFATEPLNRWREELMTTIGMMMGVKK